MTFQSSFSPNFWKKEIITVGNTLSTVLSLDAQGVKLVIFAKLNSQNNIREMVLVNANGVLKSSIFGKLGNNFSLDIEENLNSGIIELKAKTDETENVGLEIYYLPLGA